MQFETFSIISELNIEFPAIWLVKRFVLWRFSKFSAPTIAFLAFWLALRHMENSEPSLKIFRTNFSTSALYNGRNKKWAEKTRFENLLKRLFHSPLLDMKWL